VADTVVITGEKTVTVVTVGVQGPAGVSANLVPATNTTLGGIIVGANLSITGNGVLSVADKFQPKLANTTYGLTDTGIPYSPGYTNYYVKGEYVTSGLSKYYIGLRGQKELNTGAYFDPDNYAMGGYLYNANGSLQSATSVETDGQSLSLVSSNTQGFSTVVSQPGIAAIVASNATSQSIISLGDGVISGQAGTGFFELRGNQGGTGDNGQNYRLAFGPDSSYYRGIIFQQVSWKSTIGFNYYDTVSGVGYVMTNGLSFDNTPSLGGFFSSTGTSTSFRHTVDAVISGVRTGTEIRASRNKAELFFLNTTPVYTSNSILTQGYADTRYLTSANLTYANITEKPTTLAGYGITDGLTASNLTAYLTSSAAALTYLPSANFTYANITGSPDLAAYVKKTQNTTQTIASTASVGADSSTLTLNSSSYVMTVNTLAGTSTLTVSPTTATLVLAGGGSWSANSILTLGYADGRYLTSANLTYANITGKPTLANVATSGNYTDLTGTPNLTVYLTTANATATYLPSANFTYANLTGTPNLTVYLTTANASTTYQLLGNYATTSCLTFSNITGKPTTLSGYGITDGYSTSNPSGFITAGANSFTGTQNLQDNELIRAKIRDYSETVSSPTISAGTLTLNLETSNIFTVSLNAAITSITISNPPASGSGGSFTLIFTADGTARAVTWPASIKWAGGTAPTITSTSGKVDSFAFFTSDGGTNWQGYVGGQNF